MSTPTSTPSAPPTGVAVVLVSHDGARWLPGVIEGLGEQHLAPAAVVVAVDTGSKDTSVELLEAAYGAVVTAGVATGYPAAVRRGLEALDAVDAADGEGAGAEWIWLLHDDSRPAPGALRALLDAAADHPEADVLGPKLREWPSFRRLLEVGVTISGTGARETGLEPGEYDQGQHDQRRPVLAVNTAGMLVRRRVLEELGGFDDRFPVFGNDLDFGWRAAAAGHPTMVVPEAVVFHAEAAHRGLRRTPLTGRHTHYQERRAALFTLLANARARALPVQLVRLSLGTVLRMIGLLVVRSPGEALDDLAALVSVLSSPVDLRAARRARRRSGADAARARPLLAPPWMPYRHGLDMVGDVASAISNQASDVAERRRAAAAELDPSSLAAKRRPAEDDEGGLLDEGLVARYLTNPVALVLTLVVVLALVASRTSFGAVAGGALSPAPSGVGSWWHLHYDSWHALAQGTAVPAPPYVLVLALLGSILGAGGAVTLLFVGAVPFGLWGAWRFLRLAGRLVSPLGAPRWLLVAGATTYALVPATSGAFAEGRLGLVTAAALLPWLSHAAIGFADPDPDRRVRAGWRSGLLLSVVAAFAPVAWILALLLAVVVLVLGGVVVRASVARSVWAPPAAALAVPVVVLAPWWVAALVHHAAGALVLDTGRLPDDPMDAAHLLTGRIGDLGAPWWLGTLLIVLAFLALLPRATRVPVLVCWLVALLSAALAAVLGLVEIHTVALTTPAGLGVPVIVMQAALVGAVVLGAQGAARTRPRGTLRVVALGVAAVAVAVPVAGLVSFVVGEDQLTSDPDQVVPDYMVQSASTHPQDGVLVVRGSTADGLTYVVRRGEGVTLGQDEVVALTPEDPGVTATVADLLSRPTGAEVDRLGELGVAYVFMPSPVDGDVAAGLDATSGLDQASSDLGTRAWQVNRPVDRHAVDGPGSWWRIVLLVVQGLAVPVVLVLCLPTVRARRRREELT